jgi:hypothetical protein
VARGIDPREAANKAVAAVDAEMVLVAEHRDQELEPAPPVWRARLSDRLRPRLSIQRLPVSICAPFAFDQPQGMPLSLIVVSSSLVSRGRCAWITLASTICPPTAR